MSHVTGDSYTAATAATANSPIVLNTEQTELKIGDATYKLNDILTHQQKYYKIKSFQDITFVGPRVKLIEVAKTTDNGKDYYTETTNEDTVAPNLLLDYGRVVSEQPALGGAKKSKKSKKSRRHRKKSKKSRKSRK